MSERNGTDLPGDWEILPISQLTVRTKQRDPRRTPRTPFRYVDVSSVSNSSFRIVRAAELLGADAPSRARKEIQTDDVLFATVRPTLKRVALVPTELDGQIASTGFIILRADVSRVVPRYLYSRLLTDDIIKRMGELERGASYPAVRDSDVLNEHIPVPPLPEQRKIGAVLGLLQRAIGQQEQLLALTAELKKCLLHQLFTHGLRHESQKGSELGPIPQSWEVTPLAKYCSIQSGFAFKSSDYVSSDLGIPIIKIGDLQNGQVILSDRSSFVPAKFWDKEFAKNVQLEEGDLLIALTGATTGKTAEFRLGRKALLNQRLGRFRPNEIQLKRSFLKNLVLQPYFQRQIQQNILAAAQGNVSPKRIEQFLVAIPDKSEQDEIGKAFTTLDDRISLYRRKHATLSVLFRTLLHELMTARLRVNNIDLGELQDACV